MNAKTNFLIAIITLLAAINSLPVLAETMKFNGSATTTSHLVEMPLANGGAAITYNATGVAAITGDSAPNPILLSLRCNGLGVALSETEGSIEFYCTFIENETDKFDVKGTETAGETAMTVLGGSGRWMNATGAGTLKRKSVSANSSSSTFELTIETP